MTALAMRWQLRKLMRESRYSPEPALVPLSAPVDHPLVLEGIASTTDVDGDRMRFAAGAFGLPILRRQDGTTWLNHSWRAYPSAPAPRPGRKEAAERRCRDARAPMRKGISRCTPAGGAAPIAYNKGMPLSLKAS
jgi:hypothetical protein